MRAEVTPHTIQEIAAEYSDAVAWLASIGFPVERGRLAEYQQVVTSLSANFPAHGWGDLSDAAHRERLCTALLEVRELISIHRGLAKLSDEESTRGFAHYLKGPYSPKNELAGAASNRPRNIGFELYLNALFAYAGFKPLYGSDADLSFTIGEQTFFLEAKRPTTSQATKELIGKANKQLARRLKMFPGNNAKGIIALDLTKVINPDNKVMPVYGEDHLHSLLYKEDKLQIELLSHCWHRKRHERVVGVLLHYKLLTNFLPTGSLNTLKWLSSVRLVDDPAIDNIGSALKNIIREVC